MTFDQPTLPGIPAVTSSPGSEHGNTPCSSPGGPTTRRSGPARARASRFRLPGVVQGRMTLDTSGPSSPASSTSADLSELLGNRCQELLGRGGSTLYSQTWRRKATPGGLSYWEHTARAPRTSGSDSTGWPTPAVTNADRGGDERRAKGDQSQNGRRVNLQDYVMLAGWPTTSARDWKSSASNMHGENARPLNEVARLAGWATPSAAEMRTMDPERLLERRAECKARQNNGNGFGLTLGNQATLFLAETESGGQLNPAFAAWLMAIPSDWLMVAPAKKRRGRKCSAASGTP